MVMFGVVYVGFGGALIIRNTHTPSSIWCDIDPAFCGFIYRVVKLHLITNYECVIVISHL
jgi:hypothetical protein